MEEGNDPAIDERTEERVGTRGRFSSGALFLVLGLISAASAFATATVAEEARQFVLSFAAAVISFACLLWAYRLLLDRPRRDGGLLSPTVLRIFAGIYIGLPVASLATGAGRNDHTPPGVLVVQGLLYISWGIAMWRLARRRRRLSSPDRSP